MTIDKTILEKASDLEDLADKLEHLAMLIRNNTPTDKRGDRNSRQFKEVWHYNCILRGCVTMLRNAVEETIKERNKK